MADEIEKNTSEQPENVADANIALWLSFKLQIGFNAFTSYFAKIGQGITQRDEQGNIISVSYDDMRKQWIEFGNNIKFNNYNYLSDLSINNVWDKVIANGEFWKDTGSNALKILSAGAQAVGLAASQGLNILVSGTADSALASADKVVSDFFGASINSSEQIADTLNGIADSMGNDSVVMSTLGKGIKLFSDGALRTYKNGVEETSFGLTMESTWKAGASNSFYALKDKTIEVAKTTPFDAGENLVNLYGNMLLGVPPIFNNIVDPKNRALAQTFMRDAKFLTLTPGFPKYNGSIMLQTANDDAYHQTKTPEAMLSYLLKNGLDESFASKDRRYYRFKTDYEEYYSYLETMLNTIWIKMGLASTNNDKYKIYSFFTDLASGELKPQYKTSLGFFVNPTGVLTETISNEQTGFGASQASTVNEASDTYQQINYITGMGTGGAVRNAMRTTANAMGVIQNVKNWVGEVASNTIGVWTSGKSLLKKALLSVPAVLQDTQKFLTEQDQGVNLQSFATTNGMRVVYPELWSNGQYSRGININFEFISPYGDPLSIFQYVLAPFCALFCYACPRQAAENGYVSPFFVRADIPGMFTSDLAIISDFSFTRGGSGDLWTKDGLPRAISGSFTILDLYPYLAMTKRLSFLSANPSYTLFLDSLAGLHAVDANNSNDALNEYWKKMLNRVNGLATETSLWNKYSYNKVTTHNVYSDTPRTNRLGGNTKNTTSSSWLRGIK